MARRRLRKRIVIPTLLVGISLLGLAINTWVWTTTTKQQLFGHKTVYVYEAGSAQPLDDYGQIFSVGHNSGSSAATIRQASESGANVIEIDVVLLGDRLVVAHVPPMSVVGQFVFRGQSLLQVWNSTSEEAVIQLDLKESTPRFRTKVIEFLQTHGSDRTVMVATADETMLRILKEETPDVLRFLSVADRGKLNRLLADDELADTLDGVTIRWQLVNADSVSALKDRDLVVLAWTVNDLQTVNEFVELGVDGFSTNNLAVMEVLKSPEPETALHRLRSGDAEAESDSSGEREQDASY